MRSPVQDCCLVPALSQGGQYWTFQGVLSSGKLFKSHCTDLASQYLHSIGKLRLKRRQNLFSLDIFQEKRSVHCSYLVRPLVKSARCCHPVSCHTETVLLWTEKSAGLSSELRLRPDGKVMFTTYHQQPGDCGR